MNKILTSVLTLSMVTSISIAQTTMYVGGGAAMEMIEDLDNGVATELKVGMVLDNNFGLEAKVSKSIVLPEDSESGLTIEADIMTLSLFGTYNHQLTPEFTLIPKVGFSNFMTDLEASNGVNSASADDNSLNFAFGLDATYSFTPTTSLYVGYTIFNPEFESDDFDASHFSIGIQQNF
jgi:predicted porin